MSQSVGSSGTLMSTVLEGTGYAYQSFLLDQFSGTLFGPVGVLIFASTAVIVLVRYFLLGKGLNQLLWIVVAPAVVSAILFNRTETSGPLWKFGRSERNQGQVSYQQQRIYQQNGVGLAPGQPLPRVTSLFAVFSNVVGSINSTIVDAIAGARGRIDGRFILRTQLAAQLRASSVTDARLQALMQQMLLRGCHSMVEAAQNVPVAAVGGPNSPLTAFDQALATQVSVSLERTQEEKVAVEDRSPLIRELLAELAGTHPVLFSQALTRQPEEFGSVLGAAPFIEKPMRAADIRSADYQTLPNTLSCLQVWNITHLGLLHFASQENHKYREISRELIGSEEALLNDLTLIRAPSGEFTPAELQSRRAQMFKVFNRVLASYLLRNELTRPSGSGFVQEYSKKGFQIAALAAPGESDLTNVERGRNEFNAFIEKRGIFATLASLPYYQGIVLYFLSAFFPFFAMSLLIPGRIKGFILWFFLFIWAKSWDIGFAAVMLLDDYLFKLFSEQHTTPEELFKLGIGADFASTIWSVRALDPAFHLGTYYSILAVALGAVPVAASLLLMGALRGGANLVADAADGLTNTLRGAADAAFTQKDTDQYSLGLSLMKIRRGGKLFNATRGNRQVNYADDQYAYPNGMRYPYRSGNAFGRGTDDTFSDHINTAAQSGKLGGFVSDKPVGDDISLRTTEWSDSSTGAINPLKSLAEYNNMAFRFSTPQAAAAKYVLDQRRSYLEKMEDIDFKRRMSLAGNESYRTDEAHQIVGKGIISRPMLVPKNPEDGDEMDQLDAQLALHFEPALMRLSEDVARINMEPVFLSDQTDPYKIMAVGSVRGRDAFSRYNPEPRRESAPGGTPGSVSDYQSIIQRKAEQYGVDPDLISAMVAQESAFNPNAVSEKGAQGLMQLMPGTARGLGVSDPFDAEQNIDAGVRFFKQQLDAFGGDIKKALAAYNAGPERVQKYNGVPPFAETQDYIKRIEKRYRDATGRSLFSDKQNE